MDDDEFLYKLFYFFSGLAIFSKIANFLQLSITEGLILLAVLSVPVAIFGIVWWLDKVMFPEKVNG